MRDGQIPGLGEPFLCLDSQTTKTYTGGCDDISTWDLYYSDATTGGYEYWDTAYEDTGCTGGHKVCDDDCELEPQHAVQPEEPQFRYGYYSALDGWFYWDEYTEDTSQSAYCDDPADTCWNDINTSAYMGESDEGEWLCEN